MSDIGTLIRGGNLQKKDFTESGVGCIHYGQIYTHYGIWTTKTKSFVSQEFAAPKRKMHSGDIFIATTSENDDDLGKSTAWLGNSDIVTSGDGFIFRHNQNPKYISYFINSPLFHKQINKGITGTKVRRISAVAIGKVKIPIPPLEEQQRIVNILDKFDALVNDLTSGLPAEIEARRKQYEYYRDQLLTFKELSA
ncbi:restriction endonuclease subunit S [Corynebacterium rouxii]|uniref:restriction endonuclease subunit S n=1 Tax=Corynebacterium rouxii TaxID=2719119 RepID=UPI0031406F16